MVIACSSCNRPVPLSAEEVSLLLAVERSPAGFPATEVSDGLAPCVRTLVRMGYLIKAANDDAPKARSLIITERGRHWLAQNLRR